MNKIVFITISLFFGLLPIAGELILWFSKGQFNPTSWVAFCLFLVLLTNIAALKIHKNFTIAKTIFCLTLVLATSYAISIDGGLTSPLWYFQLLLIFCCSYLLGKYFALGTGFYSLCLAFYFFYFPEAQGQQLITPEKITSISVSLIAISLLSFFFEKERSLSQAREVLLQKLNTKLSLLSETLKVQLDHCIAAGKIGVFSLNLEDQNFILSGIWNSEKTTHPQMSQIDEFYEKVHRDDGASLKKAIELLRHDETQSFELQVRLKKNQDSYQLFIARGSVVANSEKEKRIACTFIDISETKLLKELQAANSELEEFSYVAAHDLRSPLRAINNLSGWLLEDHGSKLPPQGLNDLKLICSQAELMDQMVEGLLEYSLVKDNEQKVDTIELTQLLKKISNFLPAPETYNVVFDNNLPKIKTHAASLEVVLRNLIENAIKYRESDSGKVRINTLIVDNFIQFDVSDDGQGIPLEFHSKIFRLFHSLNSNSGKKTSGVGLAIVKKQVERFGGKIWVNETPSLKGLHISFLWPLL